VVTNSDLDDWTVTEYQRWALPNGSMMSTQLMNRTTVSPFNREVKPRIEVEKPLEFHQFPQLPLDLRREIWKQALPGSRIMVFGFLGRRLCALHSNEDLGVCMIDFRLICLESNEVFHQNYGRITIIQSKISTQPGFIHSPREYINF